MKKPLSGRVFLTLLIISVVLFTAGCSKKETAPTSSAVLSTVITNGLISNLTTTTVQSGGIITNNGNTDLDGQGVCYSTTNQTPTVTDSKTSDTYTVDAAGTESFTSNITGLTAGTTYYVRAYSTNTAGTAYGAVVKFTTSANINGVTATVTTLAGSIGGGFNDGTGTGALLSNPQSVTTDALNNVYVADSFNERIREITPAGVTTTFAGNGNAGYTNGAAAIAEFYGPQGIAHDPQGNFYVIDIGNAVIRKITPAGVVSTFAGNGYQGDTDGAGTTGSSFNTLDGIAVDAAGNVYVADIANYAIRKITSAGVVSTFAGGIVQTTLIGAPTGLAIDGSGDLFISDQNGRILEITSQSVLYVLAGSNTTGYVDGLGASAKFNSPQGLTVDSKGNIYVADYNNNVIRKIVVSIQ